MFVTRLSVQFREARLRAQLGEQRPVFTLSVNRSKFHPAATPSSVRYEIELHSVLVAHITSPACGTLQEGASHFGLSLAIHGVRNASTSR